MSVQVTKQLVRLRADEASKKVGLTFAELCEFVDKARELEVAPETVVYADTFIKMTDGRRGGAVRWVEV